MNNKCVIKKWKICIFIIIFIFVATTSVFYLKKLPTSKIQGKIPANSSFKDVNFYNCVVQTFYEETNGNFEEMFDYDTFNSSYKNSLYDLYKVNLTDDQLSKITNLTCSNVKDLSGINKLKNLKNLSLSKINMETLDLTNLKNLSIFTLSSADLKELLLPEDNKLEYLIINNSYLSSLDLTKINSLKTYQLAYNNIKNFKTTKRIQSENGMVYDIIFNEMRNYSEDNISISISDNISFYQNYLIIKNEISSSQLKDYLKDFSVKFCENYICNSEISPATVKQGDTLILSDKENLNSVSMQVVEFDNQDFTSFDIYRSVIEEYNRETGNNHTIKHILTEEELSIIKNLNIQSNSYNDSDFDFLKYLTNLENLYITTNVKSLNFSNNVNLKTLNLNDFNLLNIKGIENLNSLNYLYINGGLFNEISGLQNLDKLNSLTINNSVIHNLNLTNLLNLQELDLTNNEIYELSLPKQENLQYIILDNNNLSTLNTENLPNLILVSANMNLLENFDVSTNHNLMALSLISNNLNKITGLENLENLQILYIAYNNFSEIDLSNNKKLESFIIGNNNFSNNNIYILNGTETVFKNLVTIPNMNIINIYNEDYTVASLENNKVIAKKVGETTLSVFLTDLRISETGNYDEEYSLPVRTTINVYDVVSSKYMVNKEYKYIYVGDERNNKAINRYVKVKGNVNKLLKDNHLNIYNDDKEIDNFDIIKVYSDVYDIDNDNIYFNDSFSINNVKSTNSELKVINDQLQVLYNGVIIKTFKLIKVGG